MSWTALLEGTLRLVLPWYGSRRVHDADRSWIIANAYPPEHGWYSFDIKQRKAFVADREPHASWDVGWADKHPKVRGYVVGSRFIPDDAKVTVDPCKLVEQTFPVYCAPLGLGRFSRARVAKDKMQNFVYVGEEFPTGADAEVLRAFEDRATAVNHIKGVIPPLDLAFRWVTHQRHLAEKRREELEAIRAEEEKKREQEEKLRLLMKDASTAVGRRALAEQDFAAAAREALKISGAVLLDARPSCNRGESVVQYRFLARRLECVVETRTLRVVDSGVCLTNEYTGAKGDAFFTLESLPGVVSEAMRVGKLVVYRHVY